MLKRTLILITAVCLALSMAGSAFANFADSRLIRVYYDPKGIEIATDLGDVRTIVASGGSFAGDFSSLATGYAVYFALDSGLKQLWASGKTSVTSTILGGATGITSLKSGTGSMYALYMDNNPEGLTYTGPAGATSSYKNKLSATQGTLATSINNASRLNTEVSLGSLIGSAGGSVSQILYFWENATTAVAAEKIGVPVAVITTTYPGTTVISTDNPSPPTIGAATRGNGEATVTFTAPIFNGGSELTGYTVTSLDGSKSQSGLASPITVTGLDNGTAYSFTVKATNAKGDSPASAASNSVTPGTPDPPTEVVAVAGDGQATVTFKAPVFDGGRELTYTVKSSPGNIAATSTGTTIVVTGLANDTPYSFTVTATNTFGTSAPSATSLFVTPRQAGEPVPQEIGPITFSPETLLVGGTATVSAAASSYLPVTFRSTTPETCSVDGATVTGVGAGACIVAADQAGDHQFAAAATVTTEIAVTRSSQAIGPITFTPATVTVGASTTASAAGGASGNPVTFSSATPDTCSVDGSSVTGLKAGTCTVAANQAGNAQYEQAAEVAAGIEVGKAAQSILSFTLVPEAVPVGATATASATAGSGLAVTFSSGPPSACSAGGDDGSSITFHSTDTCTVTATQTGNANYEAASQSLSMTAGRAAQTVTFGPVAPVKAGAFAALSATASSGLVVSFVSTTPSICSVSGSTLTGIAAGTCSIVASQAGSSDFNAAAPVTRQTVVELSSQSIGAIAFTPPTLSAGGTTTASATASSGLAVSFATTTPTICGVSGSTVTGLRAGTCTVTAAQPGDNLYGAAPEASGDIAVEAVLPGAPAAVSAIRGNSQATVSFSAPAFDGGSSITGYTVTSLPGGMTVTGASGPLTLTGLANGTSYTFAVTAANSAGTGPASAASAAVTPATAPGAPVIGSVTAGDARATVGFDAPAADGGSPVTSYTVTAFPGGFTGTGSASPVTVAGLTNGTSYTFTVTAANSAGTGPASAASAAVTPALPLVTFTATPAAGINGSISPSVGLTVTAGTSVSFTVTPAGEYQIATVTGCGGTLSGDTYTTSGLTGNCTVNATFVAVPALKGDLNGDGKIDIADAQRTLQIAVGSKTAIASDLAAGDVAPIQNEKSVPDGKLDVADAVAILLRSVDKLSW